MNRYVLEGSAFTSREAAYHYIDQVFNLDTSTEHHLDALWDVLYEKCGAEIEIDDARDIPRQLGSYGLRLLDVFGDLQREEGFNVHIYW